MNRYLEAAIALHQYLVRAHWNRKALVGPDPGVRFNYRLGRFIKNYLSFLPWANHYLYLQGQAYWNLDNWRLFDLTQQEECRRIAMTTSQTILELQQAGGYWEYPNPEWKGRILTVEGDHAALALLETCQRTGKPAFLEGACRWYDFLIRQIGFQKYGSARGINYFAEQRRGIVPNNTTLTLALCAKLYAVTQNDLYLQHWDEMVRFLSSVQMRNGELPYSVATPSGKGRTHFLCYQYNAFELLDLVTSYELNPDPRVRSIMNGLIHFLTNGITASGSAKNSCFRNLPEVHYYTAVLGAAFCKATEIDLGNYSARMERAYRRLLMFQNGDGGFGWSRRNYWILSDRQSYPRYLAMILRHLLVRSMFSSPVAVHQE